MTGAGISTESGIPDYRSEGVGLYARTDRRPIQHAEFIRSTTARQRYWARNFVGWPQFSSHQPNKAHLVLRDWEKLGKLHWLVTQNVDALHTKAGSQRMTELHGCTHRYSCTHRGVVSGCLTGSCSVSCWKGGKMSMVYSGVRKKITAQCCSQHGI